MYRLGDLLVQTGLTSHAALAARLAATPPGDLPTLDQGLARQAHDHEPELCQTLAKVAAPYRVLVTTESVIPLDLLTELPQALAQRHRCLPLPSGDDGPEGDGLILLSAQPLSRLNPLPVAWPRTLWRPTVENVLVLDPTFESLIEAAYRACARGDRLLRGSRAPRVTRPHLAFARTSDTAAQALDAVLGHFLHALPASADVARIAQDTATTPQTARRTTSKVLGRIRLTRKPSR